MGNCLLSINLFGARQVDVTKVSFGMNLNSIEAEGRDSKTLHSTNLNGDDFSLTLVFRSYQEYASTMEWLTAYIRWLAAPDGNVSPVRVVIPARNFDKTGVLASGVTYGDKVGNVLYSATLMFRGAEDTLDRVHWADLLDEQFKTPVEGTVVPYLPASNAGSRVYGWDTAGNVVFDFGERSAM